MAVSNVSFSLCLLVILQEQQVCFKERSGEQEMGCGSPLDVSAYQVSGIVLSNAFLCPNISVHGTNKQPSSLRNSKDHVRKSSTDKSSIKS